MLPFFCFANRSERRDGWAYYVFFQGVQLHYSTGRRRVSNQKKMLRNFFTGVNKLISNVLRFTKLDTFVLPNGLLSEFAKKEAKSEKTYSF